MKKTDLEKNKGLKINNALKQDRSRVHGSVAAPQADRREQRRLDQAAGLAPFACKLPIDLMAQLQTLAAEHPAGMNGLVAELLKEGLRSPRD
jgi:hypothetical protein